MALAIYDPDERELTILIRPELEAEDVIDYSEGTVAPIPLQVVTGSIGEGRGYAISHIWTDIDLEVS